MLSARWRGDTGEAYTTEAFLGVRRVAWPRCEVQRLTRRIGARWGRNRTLFEYRVGEDGSEGRYALIAPIVHLFPQSPYDFLPPSVLLPVINIGAYEVKNDQINT